MGTKISMSIKGMEKPMVSEHGIQEDTARRVDIFIRKNKWKTENSKDKTFE